MRRNNLHGRRRRGPYDVMVALLMTASIGVAAQGPPGGRGAQPPRTPRAAAPVDFTGYWVSVVTEDWRWRMVTPPRGDFAGVPLNAAARKLGQAWDPAKDDAEGNQCKAYGAAGIMRMPGRLHITWADDSTLKVETDAGTQTRLLHFGDWKAPAGGPTRQGNTTAEWEMRQGRRGAPPPPAEQRFGNLKTVTTGLMPGYLRKNGVPFSEKTTLTEYWDLLRQPTGEQWIVITTVVEDPTYLTRTWITSLNFKKEANGSKWDPSACEAS